MFVPPLTVVIQAAATAKASAGPSTATVKNSQPQQVMQAVKLMQAVQAVEEMEEKMDEQEAAKMMTEMAYLTLGLREVIVLKLIHFKHKTSITLYSSLSLY
jgi:hypothetical protein